MKENYYNNKHKKFLVNNIFFFFFIKIRGQERGEPLSLTAYPPPPKVECILFFFLLKLSKPKRMIPHDIWYFAHHL